MTDVAHPSQHDVDAHHAAERADERCRDQPILEKRVVHRLGEKVDHGMASVRVESRSANGRWLPASATSIAPVSLSRTTRISELKVRLKMAFVKISFGDPWATMPPFTHTTQGRCAATVLSSCVVITIVTPC